MAHRAHSARTRQKLPTMATMKCLALVCTAPILVCTVPHARASTPTPAPEADAPGPSVLVRFDQWLASDWHSGWETGSTWRLMFSPYTVHYANSPEHRHVVMLGLERQREDGLVIGTTVFRNSFGQPSSYVYVGQRFDRVAELDQLFVYLTGGVLHGYKPPFDHKVPLNWRGFSPGIVASMGWQFTSDGAAQVNMLGNSGLMFQLSIDLH